MTHILVPLLEGFEEIEAGTALVRELGGDVDKARGLATRMLVA